MDCFVVTCEHGGNRIPPAYRRYFAGLGPLLSTHRGWDPGALEFARALSKALGAPCVASTTSRLLVDLNRSVGHRRLFHEAVPADPPGIRTDIVQAFHAPYRAEVEALVRNAVSKRRRLVHVSCHSITPVLDGVVRTADVGLLYDPRRVGEVALCDAWQRELASRDRLLRVRRNYPYLGKHDGLTAHLRKKHPPHTYLGVELEINQRVVFGPRAPWKALQRTLIDTLTAACRS